MVDRTKSSGIHALRAAAAVLADIFDKIDRGQPFQSSHRLCDAECEKSGLKGARAARVYDSVLGALRWRDNLDETLKKHLTKGKLKFAPLELGLLRAAAYEICIRRQDEPAGLVSEIVEIAKGISTSGKDFHKLANAVLRKLAASPANLPPEDSAELKEFASYYSMPNWMLEKLSNQRSEDFAKAAARATGDKIVHHLRVNPFKEANEELPAALGARSLGTICEGAWETDSLSGEVRKANAEGRIVVQTLPSQIAAVMLDPRPGESVLDAACGAGIKAGHLCALMSGWGEIVFLDKSEEKRRDCASNFERWNIPMPDYLICDVSRPESFERTVERYEKFDAVLLDAPCTGSGLVHHLPEKRYTLREKDPAVFGALQAAMLENCLRVLKPGGRLVYSTCSLWREENEDATAAALDRLGDGYESEFNRIFAPSGAHPGFYIEKISRLA